MTDVGLEEVIANLTPIGALEWENAVLRTQVANLEAAQCDCECAECGTPNPDM